VTSQQGSAYARFPPRPRVSNPPQALGRRLQRIARPPELSRRRARPAGPATTGPNEAFRTWTSRMPHICLISSRTRRAAARVALRSRALRRNQPTAPPSRAAMTTPTGDKSTSTARERVLAPSWLLADPRLPEPRPGRRPQGHPRKVSWGYPARARIRHVTPTPAGCLDGRQGHPPGQPAGLASVGGPAPWAVNRLLLPRPSVSVTEC
jgi:hypothetical protein